MDINGTTAAIIIFLVICLPLLISAVRESHKEGRLKTPQFKIGRKKSTPISFPVQRGEEEDFDIE